MNRTLVRGGVKKIPTAKSSTRNNGRGRDQVGGEKGGLYAKKEKKTQRRK